MTNTQRISKAAKLTVAGAGVLALLGAGAVTASAAAQPTAATAVSTVSTVSTGTAVAGTATATSAGITYRQAIKIAKKRVPGARVTKVEREWEHGHRTWKVELKKRHTEYRVYVSIRTGKIVKFRQKHDD
ncbi:hypothetical protein GCM10022226_35400 [Sphaerisporangium flaviroseum]|uniref:PepSY domain-containing protein n=1 Tax=Sphaerisporangium flaviroseum TaxID=509199 RepID=A0ABP7I7T7_9ACTN